MNQILSFIVKPDEMPSDFTGCMSMRDIRLTLPGVLREAKDVYQSDCPFTEANPNAGESFIVEMKEICNLIVPSGHSVSTLHDNLQRGMCSEDNSDNSMKKIIADIQYGLCWRVWDNEVNGRSFGCEFFEESQKYVKNIVESLEKIGENNEKSWNENYCDFVLWKQNEYNTLSFDEKVTNKVVVSRVGIVPYNAGIRVGDTIVGLIEPEHESTLPFGILGPTPSKTIPITSTASLRTYIQSQKRESVAYSDEWSRNTARDLWRKWRVSVKIERDPAFGKPHLSKKQIKRLRRSVNGVERIESERITLSAFEEPEVLNRFDAGDEEIEVRGAGE